MKRKNRKSVRAFTLLLVGFVSLQVGCAAHQTRRNHNDLLGELTRLQYEQVLNNVAMFRSGRGKVPHFAVINNSTTQINHSNAYTNGFSWNAFTFTGATLGTSGSRGVSGQFAGAPVTDAARLQRMSSALEMTIQGYDVHVQPEYVKDDQGTLVRVIDESGMTHYRVPLEYEPATHLKLFEVASSDECINHVRELVSVGVLPSPTPETEYPRGSFRFRSQADADNYQMTLLNELTCHVPTCWFGFGGVSDVPKNALYVGRFENCRAWVTCNQVDALSRFTLTMLELSTSDPASPTVEIRRLLKTPEGEIELTGNVQSAINDFITLKEIESLIEADEKESVKEIQVLGAENPGDRSRMMELEKTMESVVDRTHTKLRTLPPLRASPSRRPSATLNIAPQGLIVTPGTP